MNSKNRLEYLNGRRGKNRDFIPAKVACLTNARKEMWSTEVVILPAAS